MVDLFSKCKEEYEEGFAVAISGKVSGTYQKYEASRRNGRFSINGIRQ